jgi:hypothetical protein
MSLMNYVQKQQQLPKYSFSTLLLLLLTKELTHAFV